MDKKHALIYHHPSTTFLWKVAKCRNSRTASKKLCDFGEVADYLWVSILFFIE
jgi:hypothetical protein